MYIFLFRKFLSGKIGEPKDAGQSLTRFLLTDPPVGHVLFRADYLAISSNQRIFYLYIYVLQKDELYTSSSFSNKKNTLFSKLTWNYG